MPDEPSAAHSQARQFCLDTIKEFYGFDYRPDWHVDLDSLLRPSAENHYSRRHGGAFWTLRDPAGEIIATTGIRHLLWKPNIVEMFPDRYRRGEEIASLWRVYVRRDWRARGLGSQLTALSEAEAVRLGYGTMYLHASADALATLAFWRRAGYEFIGNCETSSHFDKRLAASTHRTRSKMSASHQGMRHRGAG